MFTWLTETLTAYSASRVRWSRLGAKKFGARSLQSRPVVPALQGVPEASVRILRFECLGDPAHVV